jgi:hypothetical protein
VTAKQIQGQHTAAEESATVLNRDIEQLNKGANELGTVAWRWRGSQIAVENAK